MGTMLYSEAKDKHTEVIFLNWNFIPKRDPDRHRFITRGQRRLILLVFNDTSHGSLYMHGADASLRSTRFGRDFDLLPL